TSPDDWRRKMLLVAPGLATVVSLISLPPDPLFCCCDPLDRRESAVGHHEGTGHDRGILRREEDDDVGNVLGLGIAFEWVQLGSFFTRFCRVGLAVEIGSNQRRFGPGR